MTDAITGTAIDRFLAGIQAGDVPPGVFGQDARLDATVPNWRFAVHGGEAVRAELGRWYADPGSFSDLRRTPIPRGELVEFTLTWSEQGIAHTCHQAHILGLTDGQVSTHTAFCGGRWPASLVADMQRANQTNLPV